MGKKSAYRIIMWISIAGVLFAGFLTFTKLITKTCPLKESCPYLLGFPVCVYGLVFFTVLSVSSIVAMNNNKSSAAKAVILYTSAAAIIFSGYFSYQELFVLCPNGCEYSLGMPSCVYGLIMYVIVFSLSIYSRNKK